MDIALTDYDSWGETERIVANLATLYREFSGDKAPADIASIFALMAKMHYQRRE